MGERGPLPQDPDARSARGGRDQTKPFRNQAWAKSLQARAERLERQGLKLIEQACKAPVIKTRNNGSQVSPKAKLGLDLLKAADEIWKRITRLGGAGPESKPPAAGGPRSLADYRRV